MKLNLLLFPTSKELCLFISPGIPKNSCLDCHGLTPRKLRSAQIIPVLVSSGTFSSHILTIVKFGNKQHLQYREMFTNLKF